MLVISKLKKFQIHHIIISTVILFLSQLTLNYIPIQLPDKTRIFIAIFFISIYFILTGLQREKITTISVFTTIMCIGTIVCLIKPVQYGLDEETHLANTIQLADSFVLKKDNSKFFDYEKVLKHDILRNKEKYKGDSYWENVGHKKSIIRGNVIGMNNIGYLPAAIGWKLGTILSKKIIVSYYLGRIFNVLAFALLASLAFKISKFYQKVIYLFSTLPFSIFLCSSYQYDNIYLGVSLLVLALLTNYFVEEKSIGVKEIMMYNAACFLFSFAKIPYTLIGAALIFYPSKNFKNKNIRYFAIISFILQMFFSVIFMYLNNLGKVPLIPGETPTLGFFIKHPFPMIRTFFDLFPNSMQDIMNPIIVANVPARLLSMVTLVIFVSMIIMLSANLTFNLPRFYQILIILLYIVISFAIIYAISGDLRVYKMGDINVGGVQGRYFYCMLLSVPAIISYDIQKYIGIGKYSIDNILFYCMAYLNVFTIGVTIYSQIAQVS